MKVRYREGIASHSGPESCGGAREGATEALTGEVAGQPLSCEISSLERRRRHAMRKATLRGRLRESPAGSTRSENLSMRRSSLHWNWEISPVPAEDSSASGSGKAKGRTPGIYPGEKSDARTVPMNDPNNRPAYKPGQTEDREGKEGAERNIEQSPAPWMQSRIRVSMGLEGLREVARAPKDRVRMYGSPG
jgi:RNA-directed DNA polymerase